MSRFRVRFSECMPYLVCVCVYFFSFFFLDDICNVLGMMLNGPNSWVLIVGKFGHDDYYTNNSVYLRNTSLLCVSKGCWSSSNALLCRKRDAIWQWRASINTHIRTDRHGGTS